jgi:hypothetical protein
VPRSQVIVDPSQPHRFRVRDHGSRLACQYCGAQEQDPIHTKLLPPPKPSRWRRGQALVETALVLPILLTLFLGILWVGYLGVMRLQLIHAATEGATAGAMNPGNSCGFAIESARKIYGLPLDEATCTEQGQMLELSIADSLTFPTPWGTDWRLSTTQRAVLR